MTKKNHWHVARGKRCANRTGKLQPGTMIRRGVGLHSSADDDDDDDEARGMRSMLGRYHSITLINSRAVLSQFCTHSLQLFFRARMQDIQACMAAQSERLINISAPYKYPSAPCSVAFIKTKSGKAVGMKCINT